MLCVCSFGHRIWYWKAIADSNEKGINKSASPPPLLRQRVIDLRMWRIGCCLAWHRSQACSWSGWRLGQSGAAARSLAFTRALSRRPSRLDRPPSPPLPLPRCLVANPARLLLLLCSLLHVRRFPPVRSHFAFASLSLSFSYPTGRFLFIAIFLLLYLALGPDVTLTAWDRIWLSLFVTWYKYETSIMVLTTNHGEKNFLIMPRNFMAPSFERKSIIFYNIFYFKYYYIKIKN